MIALLQRVSRASVTIDERSVASIEAGILGLIGVEADDDEAAADDLARRIRFFRLFADADERMNLDLVDAGANALLVPQFTLAADTSRGRRPGFSTAAAPARASELFDRLCDTFLQELDGQAELARGVFGAHMQVSLINDGPVTFSLRSRTA